MNLKLFDELWSLSPLQYLPEWKMFLEICEIYLKKHEIKNPIVVELGSRGNNQKKFYEQLLGAEHMGIDIARKYRPDIHGDTHDPRTLEALKKRLNGRSINILFIDANHSHESVKKDFEIYSPLCIDIVAFHDIETARYQLNPKVQVWKFWDELKKGSFTIKGKFGNFLFLSIHQHCFDKDKNDMGIGMMIKK